MDRDSPILGVKVNHFKYFSDIGKFYEPVGLFLGSELVSPLGGSARFITWDSYWTQVD